MALTVEKGIGNICHLMSSILMYSEGQVSFFNACHGVVVLLDFGVVAEGRKPLHAVSRELASCV